jgi:hypothetical protein
MIFRRIYYKVFIINECLRAKAEGRIKRWS